jgi:hypothetical protein
MMMKLLMVLSRTDIGARSIELSAADVSDRTMMWPFSKGDQKRLGFFMNGM